jgi:predicted DCC family thiol-disulfide oxidoreductase YuxK
MEGPVLIYDGTCNLCSATVDFLLRFDRNGDVQLAASQSVSGAMLIERYPDAASVDETVLLIFAGTAHARSGAIQMLLRFLPRPWPLLGQLLRIVPRTVRDGVYDVISRNRHRWFGRKIVCRTSAAGFESRFLP